MSRLSASCLWSVAIRLYEPRQADPLFQALLVHSQSAPVGPKCGQGHGSNSETWSCHPGWPEFTVVRRRYGGEAPPPVAVAEHPLRDRLPDRRPVAKSAERTRGTRDTVPDGVLRTLDRDVLIRVARSEPIRRTMMNYIDVSDLEA